ALLLAVAFAGCTPAPPPTLPAERPTPPLAPSPSAAVAEKAPASAPEPKPPEARREPKIDRLHGYERVDEYAWLRNKDSPEVLAHLAAENAYAEAMMKPLSPFVDALYREMLGRIKETDESAPYKEGRFYYYTRTEEGKPYP